MLTNKIEAIGRAPLAALDTLARSGPVIGGRPWDAQHELARSSRGRAYRCARSRDVAGWRPFCSFSHHGYLERRVPLYGPFQGFAPCLNRLGELLRFGIRESAGPEVRPHRA